MTQDDTFLALFAPESSMPDAPNDGTPWKIMLVDDEADIHAALRLALQDVVIEGRPLQLFDAHNCNQANALLDEHPDIALILLDVVMESEHAGLELVRHIRQQRGNHSVQIILVTGQPGYAPQRTVVMDYEIDGYRLKSELSADRIFVSVYAALRTHQAEAELVKTEEQLRLVLEGAELGFWDWNLQTGDVIRNERWATMLGYSYEEIKHTTQQWSDFVHPLDRDRAWQSINDVLEGRSPLHKLEYRMRHKDGSYRWILDQANVTQRDIEGKPLRMSGTHSDITARKQSEIEYRTFIETTHDGFWAMSIKDGHFLEVNQAYCEMVGYARDELLTMGITDLEALESPQRTQEHIDAIVKGGQERFESRHRHKQGHLVDVEISAKFIDAHDGLLVVFVRDITDRKRTEEALKLASLVYHASSEAMMVVNADNEILTVNPAFTQATGYSSDEVLGQDPKILSSGMQDKAFYDAMWQEINTTGRWKGEIWNRHKNGDLYAELLTINTIFDQNGAVFRRVALFFDITEKKRSEQRVWQQANFDFLTGLPNRSMAYAQLDRDIKKSSRDNLKLALLFIDLDRFKEVNDALGHEMGDELLKEVAHRMRDCVRESDTIGRLGGDEFIIILSELDDIDRVGQIANNILEKLTSSFYLGNELVYISASIGITIYPDDATDSSSMIKNADQAMYVAKRQGRNRFQYYMPELQRTANMRLRLANDMHQALSHDEFVIHYQPIVELATGAVCKAEALLRWQHPTQGMISPDVFIPIAEETGQIIKIGDWVFEQSARLCAHLRACFYEDFQISVNKSPVQFRTHATACSNWHEFLQEHHYPARSIVVEITEGLLMETREEISLQLFDLRDKGMQVALDDFGTGYSSLSYLKKFDIDYIKIDKSFVSNVAKDSSDIVLCEAMIVMAHKLGIKVIAEGVETQEQFALLKNIGCDYGQGYFWSKPLPSSDFERFLMPEGTA